MHILFSGKQISKIGLFHRHKTRAKKKSFQGSAIGRVISICGKLFPLGAGYNVLGLSHL